ncbi:dsDNA nuclease domain-containing protein [Rhizobium leguminosarum]|uniref:dsDNA nuclease domain-containing protein n=1 Tax=Rhizobium leguminosarum TaxID=384 RepID=UPI001C972CD2|nr:dsDNA nuclease domain-containing protein [Rhizobium leguminosarum]MBY5645559.1 DUF4297 domain-containing protein [Rhizobium leguminosarum]
MAGSTTEIDPTTLFDVSDPGDATQQNFRYQHLYGVILLVAAARGTLAYSNIYCEHFEDFLCEKTDGMFDGYQVKTQRPENGAWRTTDDALIKSLGRFVDLHGRLGAKAGTFFFVSNTECDNVTSESKDEAKRGRCPALLLRHIRSSSDANAIQPPFKKAFDALRAECGCAAEQLFATLQRVEIILGPGKREIEAAVSNEHLACLAGFDTLAAAALNTHRDDIAAIVHRASSLQITDAVRHVAGTVFRQGTDVRVSAKRLSPTQILQPPNTQNGRPAHLFPGLPVLGLGSMPQGTVLEQKLKHGGLEEEIDYMRMRERAAEYSIMEDIVRRPERYPALQTQIENVVLGACSEAHLRHRSDTSVFGPAMLVAVQDALKAAAKDRADQIGHHNYECLVGVAGLFTSECRVWWSPRFQIDQEAAE